MSTHSYEGEAAQQEDTDPDPDRSARKEEPDADLMYDLVGANVRGFYAPYHPMP